ncbi:MAG TPA: ATP-binding protein, partial [Bryobacteraceae bacterium]|nr:ATP-binding protein [Bryobacteraceae bacterium]
MCRPLVGSLRRASAVLGWRTKLAILAALLALAPIHLSAVRPPIRVYSTALGMPTTSANCLTPDSNGLLWICTNAGLVRFDGSRFHVFGPQEGLPSGRVLGFVISRRGGYWVTTDVGVCRLPPGSKVGDKCEPLSSEKGEYLTEGLVELEDGTTFIATRDRVFRASAAGHVLEPTTFQYDPHFRLVTMAALRDGRMLIGTETGLLVWRNGEKPQRAGGNQLREGLRHIRIASHESAPGVWEESAWISGAEGLFRMTLRGGANDRLERVAPELADPLCAVPRRDGSVWMSSALGISQLAPDANGRLHETRRYTIREGLPASAVDDLVEDSQGNLWGVTDGSGLFRLARGGFTTYTGEDGLGSARISSVFEDLQGRLCVTVSTKRSDATNFRVFERGRFQAVNLGHRSGWGWNQFGFQAHDGEWWFPSGEGLYRFPATSNPTDLPVRHPVALYNAASGLGGAEVFRAFEDSRGNVWISTLGRECQLVRWERKTGTFHRISDEDGWPRGEIVSVIRESSSGTFWIGTFRYVIRIRNGKVDVLSPFPEEPPSYVRDLLLDHSGRVWVATARNGLYRCDDGDAAAPVFRNYTARQGLSADSVRCLTEDNSGFVYAGTIRGVDRIDPRAAITDRSIRHFTPADGLPDSEQNVAYRDRRGHLWFGSLNGLSELDPSVDTSATPPQIYITRIRSRGVDIPLPWEGVRQMAVSLAPDRNQLEIEYAGIDLRSVASLRYQYRLTGISSDWSEPTEQLSVNYTTLPVGRLGFEARAVGADGQVSPAVSLAISVQAPVWRRGWFLSLAGLLAVAAGSLLYNYRVRHLIAMERLRTRIATDLHDDIGASLTQISILSELARRNLSRDTLSDVADLARQLVEDMSDIVWAVNPRHDRFDALAHRMRRFASDMLADRDLEFDALSLPADLKIPLEYRRPLFLIFKEAVNNVARHSGATAVLVRLALKGSALKLMVQDNGGGFDTSARLDGEGIGSVRKRVRDLGGSAEWKSDPGHGTCFEATLPLG